MTRSIDTSSNRVRKLARDAERFGAVISGTLAEEYDGVGKVVFVRLGRTSSSGIIKAAVTQNSLLKTSYPEDTPVSLKIQRGKPEVIAFGASAQSPVVTILEKTGATQSIATGISSEVKINFATSQVVYDPYSTFTDADDSISIPFDGYYRIHGYNTWNAGTGYRRIYIYKNAVQTWWRSVGDPNASVAQSLEIYAYGYFDADDTIQLYGSQNSGGNLTCNAAGLTVEMVK